MVLHSVYQGNLTIFSPAMAINPESTVQSIEATIQHICQIDEMIDLHFGTWNNSTPSSAKALFLILSQKSLTKFQHTCLMKNFLSSLTHTASLLQVNFGFLIVAQTGQ